MSADQPRPGKHQLDDLAKRIYKLEKQQRTALTRKPYMPLQDFTSQGEPVPVDGAIMVDHTATPADSGASHTPKYGFGGAWHNVSSIPMVAARSYGGQNLTFGVTAPNSVYIFNNLRTANNDFQQQGGFELSSEHGIWLPGNGSGVYLVNFHAVDQGANWQTKDWALNFETFTDLTPSGFINARVTIGSLVTNQSRAASPVRLNVLQAIDHFTIFPPSGAATRTGMAFSIGSGVVIPATDTTWNISYKVMIVRVGNYA